MKDWDELTKKERRVALAKDILEHLDSLDIQDGRGYLINKDTDPINGKGDITKEDCDELRKTCCMCARGALVLSRIDLFNSVGWDDLFDPDSINSDYLGQDTTTIILEGSFGKKQLGKIESAFEKNEKHAIEAGCTYHTSVDCELFGENFSDPKERLRAIMENVVKNGKFVP